MKKSWRGVVEDSAVQRGSGLSAGIDFLSEYFTRIFSSIFVVNNGRSKIFRNLHKVNKGCICCG